MVDYSKWDNFDSDEDDEEKTIGHKPVVTRFDKPQSVTLPGRIDEGVGDVKSAEKVASATDAPTVKNELKSQTENGSDCGSYYWHQDESQVEIFFRVDTGVRGRNVNVSVDGDAHEQFIKLVVDGRSVIDQKLAFQAAIEEDSDLLDWSVEDEVGRESSKVVRVTLRKKSPSGTVSWCSRIFEEEEPIDMKSIKGRGQNWKSASEVFAEATEMFKKKVAEGKVGMQLPVETASELENHNTSGTDEHVEQ